MADTTAKLHPNDVQFRQTRAAAEHIDEIVTAAVAITANPTPSGRYPTMRGMKRLANLAPSIVASLDAEADKVADELVANQERATAAIGQFRGFATAIGQTADEITAALGQITNDPTQTSGV